MITSTPFIDLTPYARPVRLSVTTAITLPTRLLKAAPAQPSPRVHAALGEVRDRTKLLQERLIARQRRINLRPVDSEFDGSWAAVYGRIHAHTRVVANPRRAEAVALLGTLFPDGLEFLKAGFEDEWIYAKTLLERIEADGHLDAVEALAGPVFLGWARDATIKLGDALGVGEAESERSPSVKPLLIAISHAIANYGRIYAGELDLDDVEALAGFRAAMAPIDEHRSRSKRPAKAGASEDEELIEDGEEGPDELDEVEDFEDFDAPLPELPPLD